MCQGLDLSLPFQRTPALYFQGGRNRAPPLAFTRSHTYGEAEEVLVKRGAIWSSWCCNRSVKRSEFIRRLVLNYISDDYENVDQCILHDVGKDGTRCGLTIERHEIVAALGQLIEDGLAKRICCPAPSQPGSLRACRRSTLSSATSKHTSTSRRRGWIFISRMMPSGPSTMKRICGQTGVLRTSSAFGLPGRCKAPGTDDLG